MGDQRQAKEDDAAVEMSLEARPERVLIRPGGSHRHVDYWIRVPEALRRETPARQPLALALVLDRSGSMSGDKLTTAKRASLAVLERLEERDQVALVVYDDHIDTIQSAAPATARTKAAIRAALMEVEARATTALYEGWLTGCQAIAGDAAPGAEPRLARCFLLTDGLANVGLTDPEQIAREAAGIRDHAGITTSTFGIGRDYDEQLLGPMAVAGGGQFHHLRSPHDIANTFMGELGEMLAVAASAVQLELEVGPELGIDLVSAYWEDGDRMGRCTIAVGDLLGGEERHVVVRFRFPPRSEEASCIVRARLVWQAGGATQSTAWKETRFTCADDAACDAESRDAAVMHWVGVHHAERAKRKAVEHSRQGDLRGARKVLRRVARRIASYAGSDADLQAALGELEEVEREVADRPVDGMYAKELRYQTQRTSRGQRDHRG